MKLPRESLLRLLRFGTVGVTVMFFFMALNWAFGRVLAPQLAFLAAYPPALLLHYLLNKRWTFADATPTDSRKVADYLHTVLVTFLIQWPVFTLAQTVFGCPAWFAAGVANLTQMTASFLLLQWRVFHPDAAKRELTARDAWGRLLGLVVTLALSALLLWTVLGKWEFPRLGGEQGDYYNRLLRGFQHGTLALDLPVPPRLAQLATPWDPTQRPADLFVPPDVSYANGKFYLYFGVAPVVTLLAPFKLLTGQELPFPYALATFVLAAFWMLAALWLRVVRDQFPRASLLTRIGGLVVLGLCGGLLVLARRANFWELPIAAGQFYLSAFVACSYAALRAPRPSRWLALAGLCLGLAVGCRPTLVVAGAGLAVLVLALTARAARRDGAGWLPTFVRHCLWAGVPLALCVAALLAYNQARFGNPLEFGLNYQLTSVYEAKARHFSLSYVPFNLRAYFWVVPEVNRYFPFLSQPELPTPPAGYYSAEFVYGLFWVCPVLLLVALTGRQLARRRDDWPADAAVLVGVCGAMALVTTALMLCFNTAVSRYEADFLPWWLLCGLVGFAAWEQRAAKPGLGRALFAVAAGVSGLAAFLGSSALHGMLLDRNPEAYRALGRAFNTPIAWWEKLTGQSTGPVEMEVYFSIRPGKGREPLLALGRHVPGSAMFYVEHLDDDRVKFSFESARQELIETEPIALPRGRPHRVRLETGALYPPAEHPLFADRSPLEIASVKDWVRIAVDGRMLLDRAAGAPEIPPDAVAAGADRRSGRDAVFSGVIDRVTRTGLPPPLVDTGAGGDVSLAVKLPAPGVAWTTAFAVPANEVGLAQPLVTVGESGRSDLLAVAPAEESFKFFYERWGAGLVESPIFPLGAERALALRVRLGSLLAIAPGSPLVALRRTLAVWQDGKPIWWLRTEPPPADAGVVRVARNAIGSNAAATLFRGRIGDWRREPAPAAWRAGPFAGVELTLGGRGVGTQPLVATGKAGAANTLAIDWSRPGVARLLYDHWGYSATSGPEFAWADGEAHALAIELPAFPTLGGNGAAQKGPLRVRVDGRVVWETEVSFYPAASETLVLGENRAGSSVAAPELTSVLLDVRQVPLGNEKP
ncbi:MAG: GtrA family protein [Opitutae bacterium]|nr:GtrA family protein [Opitutae bacterium]